MRVCAGEWGWFTCARSPLGRVLFLCAAIIGGDSDLSPRGQLYAKRLRAFMAK
jgi:hypothetical protein